MGCLITGVIGLAMRSPRHRGSLITLITAVIGLGILRHQLDKNMPDIYDIAGCELSYYCAQDWNALTETNDPEMRFCKECKKNVRVCRNYEEFDQLAKVGHCVAFLAFTDSQVKEMMEMPVPKPLGLPKRR